MTGLSKRSALERREDRPALSRVARVDQTRRDLFQAAAAVVGEIGYEAASISMITRRAGVASGTFYNYFVSRQELFDQLLPAVGEQLLARITAAVDRDEGGVARERARFRAYFDFFAENPGFGRILNEAVVFAPRAYTDHLERFVEGYARALGRSLGRGEVGRFENGELRTLAFMLMGARSYLSTLQTVEAYKGARPTASDMENTYMKVIETGLFGAVGARSDAVDTPPMRGAHR